MGYGMKIGGQHDWKYHSERWKEKKIGKHKWAFKFQQTKTRKGHKAPIGTGMPIGSRLHWRIKGIQYAVKTSPNSYKLVTKGIKTQAGFKLGRGKKKWIRPKYKGYRKYTKRKFKRRKRW